MRISIIGAGYVGLVTGICLATRGHKVTFVDSNREKIDAINKGKCPVYESGLEENLKTIDDKIDELLKL